MGCVQTKRDAWLCQAAARHHVQDSQRQPNHSGRFGLASRAMQRERNGPNQRQHTGSVQLLPGVGGEGQTMQPRQRSQRRDQALAGLPVSLHGGRRGVVSLSDRTYGPVSISPTTIFQWVAAGTPNRTGAVDHGRGPVERSVHRSFRRMPPNPDRTAPSSVAVRGRDGDCREHNNSPVPPVREGRAPRCRVTIDRAPCRHRAIQQPVPNTIAPIWVSVAPEAGPNHHRRWERGEGVPRPTPIRSFQCSLFTDGGSAWPNTASVRR